MTTKETFKYRGYSATCRVETVYVDEKLIKKMNKNDRKNNSHYSYHVTTITKDDNTDSFAVYSNRNRYIKWRIDLRIVNSRQL